MHWESEIDHSISNDGLINTKDDYSRQKLISIEILSELSLSDINLFLIPSALR